MVIEPISDKSPQEQFEAFISFFDVAKYHDARKFDARQWYFEISRRSLYRSQVFRDTGSMEETIASLVTAPIADGDGYGNGEELDRSFIDLPLYVAWDMHATICKDGGAYAACQELKKLDDWQPDPSLEMDSNERWAAIWKHDEEVQQKIGAMPSFNSVLANVFRDNMNVYAEINLSAPDDVIFQDFKRWLSLKRKSADFDNSPVKRFTDGVFAGWAQKRILAYLDLTLVAHYLGVDLPYHRIGALMFPEIHDIDLGEKVRKTIAPEVTKLLSPPFLGALHEAAAAKDWQQAEEKKGVNPSG